MKTFKVLTLVVMSIILIGCVDSQPIPCSKSAKQISKMTDGTQYSHCYDANFTW